MTAYRSGEGVGGAEGVDMGSDGFHDLFRLFWVVEEPDLEDQGRRRNSRADLSGDLGRRSGVEIEVRFLRADVGARKVRFDDMGAGIDGPFGALREVGG